MTQFCIEEAVLVAYDIKVAAEMEADIPPPRPGEIVDPVMADAMAKAKELHAHKFGGAS